MKFVIEFDSAEEMAAYVAERTGQPMELRYALANDLPQSIKVAAQPGSTEDGPVIVLHILSRGTEDAEGIITIGPGETRAV